MGDIDILSYQFENISLESTYKNNDFEINDVMNNFRKWFKYYTNLIIDEDVINIIKNKYIILNQNVPNLMIMYSYHFITAIIINCFAHYHPYYYNLTNLNDTIINYFLGKSNCLNLERFINIVNHLSYQFL
jgi:hypothetical protein